MGKVQSGLVLDAVTIAADVTSDNFIITKGRIAFSIKPSGGTHVGTVAIQGSINQEDWFDLVWLDSAGANVSSLAIANGVATAQAADDIHTGFRVVRLKFTSTSGTGTLSGWISQQGYGR